MESASPGRSNPAARLVTFMADPAVASIGSLVRPVASLRALAVILVARWGDFDDKGRLDLVRRIERVTRELEALSAEVVAAALKEAQHLAISSSEEEFLNQLTDREMQTLRALARGMSTSQVAQSLGISPTTVRSHVKSVLAKLGVHSRLEAVTLLLRHDLSHAAGLSA